MLHAIHCPFTVSYTQTLQSQMSKYVTLKVLQSYSTQKEEWLGGGSDVYLPLFLDYVVTLHFLFRYVLFMVE